MAFLVDDPRLDRVLQEFGRELTAQIIEPWRRRLKGWLRARTHNGVIGNKELASISPDSEKMAKLLNKWGVRLGNLGGQLALDRIATSLFGVRRPRPKVREAAGDLTLAERLDLGEEWNQLDGDFVFFLRDAAVLTQIRNMSIEVTGRVTENMLADARALFERNFRQGLGPRDLAAALDDIFPKTYKNRGLTIARTTGLQAQSIATHESYKENGVLGKEWLATLDDGTRDDHRAAHGQVRRIDKPFNVGGVSMQHPRVPGAPAEQVINCRCDELPVTDPAMLGLSDTFGAKSMPGVPWLGQALTAAFVAKQRARPEEEEVSEALRQEVPLVRVLPWRCARPDLRGMMRERIKKDILSA